MTCRFRPSRAVFPATLGLLALLCGGNTFDTLPLYPMDPMIEEVVTREVDGWTATWVVRPRYTWMEPFIGRAALVASGGACENILKCPGGRWGAISDGGQELVTPAWERIRTIWPRLAFEVDRDGWKGVVSVEGKLVVSRVKGLDVDDEGWVRVSNEDGTYDLHEPGGKKVLSGASLVLSAGPDRVWVQRGKRWALYSRDGRQATPLRYHDYSPSDGPAFPVRIGRTWGLIDSRGKQLAPFSYSSIGFVIGRVFPVNVGGVCKVSISDCQGGRVGAMDQRGRLVLPARYACVEMADAEDGTSELLAMEDHPARLPGEGRCDGGIWRLFDGQGKPILADSYAFIDFFRGRKVARAVRGGRCSQKGACSGGKWGIVDRAGKVVVPFRYDWIDPIDPENGTAFVVAGKWGLFSMDLREVVPARHELVDVDEGAVRFRDGGRWGLMDPSGKVLVPARFERLTPFREKHARFSSGGRWGLIAADGKVVVAATYAALCSRFQGTYVFTRTPGCQVPVGQAAWATATPVVGAPILRDDFADPVCVCASGGLGLIDITGRELFPPKYSRIDVDPAGNVPEAVAKASTAAAPIPVPPGAAWVRLNEGATCDAKGCRGGRWGLADLKGRILIPVSQAWVSGEQNFVVRVAEGGPCDGDWHPGTCRAGTKWGLMTLSPGAKTTTP